MMEGGVDGWMGDSTDSTPALINFSMDLAFCVRESNELKLAVTSCLAISGLTLCLKTFKISISKVACSVDGPSCRHAYWR